MTKKDIVKTISEKTGLTQQKTKEIVQETFDVIVETLVDEGRIELRNFGVFEIKERAARKARNPKTGDKVHVPQKFVVTFKPGKVMEDKALNFRAKRGDETKQGGLMSAGTAAETLAPPGNPTDSPPRDIHQPDADRREPRADTAEIQPAHRQSY